MQNDVAQSKHSPCVGVLALQGGYDAHITHLDQLNISSRKLRFSEDFDGVDGLILPGGESSVMLKLIERNGLKPTLINAINRGIPTLATCAGMILLAKTVYTNWSQTQTQDSLGILSVTVVRNGWGRQIESGLHTVKLDHVHTSCFLESTRGLNHSSCQMMFVRAPRLLAVDKEVSICGRVVSEPVWVQQNHVHALCGHPELGDDPWVHRAVFKDLCPS